MNDSVREKAEKIARQWLDVDNERWEHLHEDMVRIIAEGLDAYAAQQTAALRAALLSLMETADEMVTQIADGPKHWWERNLIEAVERTRALLAAPEDK